MFTDPDFEPLYHSHGDKACGGIAFYYRVGMWFPQPGFRPRLEDARMLDGEPPLGASVIVCCTCGRHMSAPPVRKEG